MIETFITAAAWGAGVSVGLLAGSLVGMVVLIVIGAAFR